MSFKPLATSFHQAFTVFEAGFRLSQEDVDNEQALYHQV
jgi:hypothetical protein